MIILGVDPGLRHLGVAVLEDGKVLYHDTMIPPGRGKISTEDAIRAALCFMSILIEEWGPDYAVVEQVTWYGKRYRIMLPLSHIAGACVGYLVHHCPVYLLLANQRRPVRIPKAWLGESWDDHQRDAAALATVVRRHHAALAAGDPSMHPKLSAVARRIITVPKAAHG